MLNLNQKKLTDYEKDLIIQKYEEALELIEYILIESTSYLKMFGYFYMCLNKKIIFIDEVNFYKEISHVESGLVYIEDETLNFIVDPVILFDRKCIFKLLFKILHEILHAMLKHHSRKPNDIKDALLYNLAADHLVNSIIQSLYKNSTISKVAYFSDREFYIERFENIPNNDSVDNLFDHILNCNEFDIAAKRVTVTLTTDENKQNSVIVEDIIKASDLSAINKKLESELFHTISNINDDEFSMTAYTNNVNTPIDNDLYIKTTKSPIFNKLKIDDNQSVGVLSDDFENLDSTNNLFNIEPNYSKENFNNNQMEDAILSFVIIHVHDKITKKSYQVIYDLENRSSGSEQIERESSSVYSRYKEELKQAFGQDGKGTNPSNKLSIFDEVFKVEYPWDVILKNAILTKSQKGEERSFTVYDIYRSHLNNIRFPGVMNEYFPEILCACIDSSASMTDEDLKKIISILCTSVGKYSDIIIYVHDVRVHDTIYINNIDSENEIFERINKIKGRGGTSHIDVFKKIQELVETCTISTLLFFTDFDSDVPANCTKFPVLNSLESIWCIFNKGNKYEVNLPIPTLTINIENLNFKKQ